jgi:hypothetical protein
LRLCVPVLLSPTELHFTRIQKNRLSQNSPGTYNKKNKGKKLPVLYRISSILKAFGANHRISVPDPWHFSMDPDPRIRTFYKRIRLFSSVIFKTPTKLIFVSKFLCLFLFENTFTYCNSSTFEDQGFSSFFCLLMERSGSVQKKITDPDQGGPKTYGSYGSDYGRGHCKEYLVM